MGVAARTAEDASFVEFHRDKDGGPGFREYLKVVKKIQEKLLKMS